MPRRATFAFLLTALAATVLGSALSAAVAVADGSGIARCEPPPAVAAASGGVKVGPLTLKTRMRHLVPQKFNPDPTKQPTPPEILQARAEAKLDEIGAATTVSVDAGASVAVGPADPCGPPSQIGKFRVTECFVTATLITQAILPIGAPEATLDHESGHAQLADALFPALAEKAYPKACTAVRALSFKSKADAESKGMTQFAKKVMEQSEKIYMTLMCAGNLYDALTMHGKLATPTAAQAASTVIAKYKNAMPGDCILS